MENLLDQYYNSINRVFYLCYSMMKTLEKYHKYSYSALETNQPANDAQVCIPLVTLLNL